MKYILSLFLASVQLFALELSLNSGKENKINYAILHIMDEAPFYCEMIPDALDKKRYLCQIARPITTNPIKPKKMKYAELDFYEKEGIFYIAIEPKIDSKLIPVEDTLYETIDVLAKPKEKYYTHWTILFQEKPLYEEKSLYDSIDFPVVYAKHEMPSVGALDLNGKPISYAQSKDIQLYLDIKKDYEHGNYDDVVKNIKRVLDAYPNSIFRSELELYEMRSMDKILSTRTEDSGEFGFNENNIIDIAKGWTKSFASDENIPEVLMLMTKSYLKMGSKSDANYFLDILVNEHPDNIYTKKAILLFADSLFIKKAKDKAMKLYLDVLYSAQDLDVASEAAIRLSDHQMDAGKLQEAKEYLLKVLNVNANYLLKDPEASHKLAKRLYEHKLYDLAAKISDLLLENLPKKDESRELLLKESGDWHAKANEVETAHKRYQEYLDAYKNDGNYVQEVTERLDALFFKLKENNETKLANYYDKLIDTYGNEIGQKALLEKAKLLLKQKRYEEVLALQDALVKVPDHFDVKPDDLIYEAARLLAIQQLDKGGCQGVVDLIETYKLQITEAEHESKLYACFMQQSRYDRAKEIADTHLKDTSLKSRYTWAQKEVQTLYKMNQYKEAVAFKEDLKTLTFTLREKISLETIRALFFSLVKLNNLDGAASLAQSQNLNLKCNFLT